MSASLTSADVNKIGTLTPEVARELNNEADARFWAQTGYHPHKRLDPQVAADRAFVPVWTKIHDRVLADWKAGHVTLTYKTPAVAGLLAEASDAAARVFGHVLAAFGSPDPAIAAQHMAAANDAHQAAGAAAGAAATQQPISVSAPDVVQAASNAMSSIPVVSPPSMPGQALTHEQAHAAASSVTDAINVVRAPTVSLGVPTGSPATPAPVNGPSGSIDVSSVNQTPSGAPSAKVPWLAGALVAAGLGFGAMMVSGKRGRGRKRRSRSASPGDTLNVRGR